MNFALIPGANDGDSIVHNKDSFSMFIFMFIKRALEEVVSNPSDLIVPVVVEADFGVGLGLWSELGREFGRFIVNIYLFF